MSQDNRLSAVLHALLHMADHGGPLTSAQLAQMMSTNPVVVRRTMAGLREAGLVRSEKGHGGGWELARDLNSVTLRDIYDALIKQVDATNRWDWVEDELELLRSISTYVVQPEEAWERLKTKLNRPRDLAALKVLAAWRERRAQESDQPRSRVLKDDALVELAMQRPTSPEVFDKLRAVQRGFGRSSAAAEIIALMKQVEALTKSELPAMPERYRGPSPKGAVGDLIRVLLKAVSEEHGVAARILATSDEIDALVLDDNADVPALKGWRRKLFGDKALAIKHGKIGLAATRKGVIEFELPDA